MAFSTTTAGEASTVKLKSGEVFCAWDHPAINTKKKADVTAFARRENLKSGMCESLTGTLYVNLRKKFEKNG